MVKFIKTIFLTLLFIVGITFSMENTQPVILRYYEFDTPPIPLFSIVLFGVLLGVLVAGVGFLFDQRSLKRALREKEREAAYLERELQPYKERERPT